ncbi:dihydrofolate reductase [Exilibacterium tricleocarpae]|uniref:Dihydrofolate reductase n=1 Tax=Exilibacterium tricleocarpae TaxID=2591008 RepID=A0A545T0B9_9GAMM|nr:dihydrofolate reductase family protein [Exilibacterium tricleocarpae]TQV70668.1 dihydrofolate reductase [Exilibacterium tricleocarpae]
MSALVYYVAASLDGFIAHEDGSFDGFQWDDEVVSDFLADVENFGTVLMGRKTYEVGLKEGKTSPYPTMRQILFSRTMESSPDEAVELVQGDIAHFVRELKAEASHPIWLCGGADIATTLLQAGLIDSVVVKLNPVLFGSGVPLVSVISEQVGLNLKKAKQYKCGIVFLTYSTNTENEA